MIRRRLRDWGADFVCGGAGELCADTSGDAGGSDGGVEA